MVGSALRQATPSSPADRAPPSPRAQADADESQQVQREIAKCLFEALPQLREAELVDILEFIAAQHSGNNFNADNSAKALDVCAFVQKRPFAVSKEGVAAIARLARHALGSAPGDEKTAAQTEHKLWLITSGALNTAAAISSFDGDAVSLFDALQRDGVVRGKYRERQYAIEAMRDHLQDPGAYRQEEDGDELILRKLNTIPSYHIVVAILLLLLAIWIAGVGSSEMAQRNLLEKVGPWVGYVVPPREGPLYS